MPDSGRRRVLLPYLTALLIVEVLLVVAYILLPHSDFFDLDKEYNLPSLFSTLQLAGIGVASLFAFEAERGGPARRAPLVWAWPLIGLGFFYLAADEMLAIHEGVLTDVVRHVLPPGSLIQAVMPWQMIFAPGILGAFIMIGAMGYTRLAGRRSLLAAALGGLGLWALSFVLEGAAKPIFIPRGLYRLEVGLEESAEMLGETLLLFAFASYALAAMREEIVPREVVPWRLLLGTAGGLVAVAGVAIAAVTVSNPGYLHRRAGDKFVEKHEYDSAVTAYRRALAIVPNDADITRRLARAQLDGRHYADAAVSYRRALDLLPPNAELENDLGVALQRAGEMDEAIAAYEAALGIEPAYGRAHDNLGLALESRRDIAGAEAHFRQALGDRRVAADAHRFLGNLLERRGQLQEAREHWRQSLAAEPHQRDAQGLRRRIDQADRALSPRHPASAS
jgi:tetratricopeptide (TPR) repeat protein